nr:relaxin receptor 2-like [Cherax quadricarinatus]
MSSAAADLLMGVLFGDRGRRQDVRTRGKFHSYALQWAASYVCTFAGILALVSSETSVFILTFMSLERYLYISETLDSSTLSEKSARMCLSVIWLTSISLALFPTLWVRGFYGSNVMCFPLHINEPYLVGWQYSAFIFLGLNIVRLKRRGMEPVVVEERYGASGRRGEVWSQWS